MKVRDQNGRQDHLIEISKSSFGVRVGEYVEEILRASGFDERHIAEVRPVIETVVVESLERVAKETHEKIARGEYVLDVSRDDGYCLRCGGPVGTSGCPKSECLGYPFRRGESNGGERSEDVDQR